MSPKLANDFNTATASDAFAAATAAAAATAVANVTATDEPPAPVNNDDQPSTSTAELGAVGVNQFFF